MVHENLVIIYIYIYIEREREREHLVEIIYAIVSNELLKKINFKLAKSQN